MKHLPTNHAIIPLNLQNSNQQQNPADVYAPMREVKVVENQSYERMQKIQAKRSNEESVLQALTKQSQLPETEKELQIEEENFVKNEDAP